MKHCVVWLGRVHGKLALTQGQKVLLDLAASSGNTASAVLTAGATEPLADAVQHELEHHGVRSLVCLRLNTATVQEPKNAPGPEWIAKAFVWALQQPCLVGATDIIATANAAGRDLMARVSAQINAQLLQDCIAVDFTAGTGEKLLLQGRTCGVYALSGPIRCWTLRPNSTSSARPLQPCDPIELVDLSPPSLPLTVRPSSKAQCDFGNNNNQSIDHLWANQPDIMEAAVIVSGGRALESADNFRLLHEVAAPLHAAVGASRSAVDMGYAPPFAQVGQTGFVVSPALYIACGISGSIFHTTGIKSAGTVVAINSDAGAPIFQRADYGLKDDLFAVLPVLRSILESS